MAELTPTRTTYLEVQGELRQFEEGYHFLDEKSLLLAHEILRQLAIYEANLDDLRAALSDAIAAFTAAAARHGFDGLEVYPAADAESIEPELRRERFVGLELLSQSWPAESPPARAAAVEPSPEAAACRRAFARLLELNADQAVVAANLLRLRDEYVRTERRARALDQLIMPDMRRTLRQIDDQLESVDQEEAMRVRHAAKLAGRA